MIELLSKHLRRLERRWIPNLRNKIGYKVFKAIVFLPFAIVLLAIQLVFGLLYKYVFAKLRFKRKGNTDIVFKNIVDGWANLAFPNARVEQIATKRAQICAECPSAVFSGGYYMIAVDSKLKKIRGLKCGECGCALSAKVRSLDDRCPLGKW